MKKYTYAQYQKDLSILNDKLGIKSLNWDNLKGEECFEAVSSNYWKNNLKRANSKKYVEAVREFFG